MQNIAKYLASGIGPYELSSIQNKMFSRDCSSYFMDFFCNICMDNIKRRCIPERDQNSICNLATHHHMVVTLEEF